MEEKLIRLLSQLHPRIQPLEKNFVKLFLEFCAILAFATSCGVNTTNIHNFSSKNKRKFYQLKGKKFTIRLKYLYWINTYLIYRGQSARTG
jgi:hypothetical protein